MVACSKLCPTSKCMCRNLDLEESERLAHENMKDIIACGFDPDKTFIFTDFGYLGGNFSRNIKRIERCRSQDQQPCWQCMPGSSSSYGQQL